MQKGKHKETQKINLTFQQCIKWITKEDNLKPKSSKSALKKPLSYKLVFFLKKWILQEQRKLAVAVILTRFKEKILAH